MENNLRNHPEERLKKIEELKNELAEHQCTADNILADVKSVTERWILLKKQVNIQMSFFSVFFFAC